MVQVLHEPVTFRRLTPGKRQKVQRNVQGTKAEARKERDRIRREHESGLDIDASKITFGQFADTRHEARIAADEVVRTRLEREVTFIRDMSAFIGDVRLRDLTPQTVESLYAAIKREAWRSVRAVLGKR